jgi:hypothetical protein
MKNLTKGALLSLLLLLCGTKVEGQSISRYVFGSSGTEGSVGSVLIYSNVGEMMVNTISAGTDVLTQGFEQPENIIITSLHDLGSGQNFLVFPNPVLDKFNIRYNGPGPLTVSIYTVQGALLWRERPSVFEQGLSPIMDVTDLKSGIYLIMIENREGQALQTSKFIKL